MGTVAWVSALDRQQGMWVWGGGGWISGHREVPEEGGHKAVSPAGSWSCGLKLGWIRLDLKLQRLEGLFFFWGGVTLDRQRWE